MGLIAALRATASGEDLLQTICSLNARPCARRTSGRADSSSRPSGQFPSRSWSRGWLEERCSSPHSRVPRRRFQTGNRGEVTPVRAVYEIFQSMNAYFGSLGHLL